jgi:hypothetical protein
MGDMRADALAVAIEQIYEAALRPELWRSVLDRVTDALGSDNAGIFGYPDPATRYSIGPRETARSSTGSCAMDGI